jgi:hypothetical protein
MDHFATNANARNDDSLMKSLAQTLLRIVFLLIGASCAWADGGQVQFQHVAGSFVITLFTAAEPIYTGNPDVSVMVQDRRTREPLLDAHVELFFRGENGMMVYAKATREQVQNKLLYGAIVTFPKSGLWNVKIDVSRGADSASTTGNLTILPSKSAFSSSWGYLLIPPLGIFLFLLHQWLKTRQSKQGTIPAMVKLRAE